jgi:hypothetical protein
LANAEISADRAHLPVGPAYIAPCAPIAEGAGYAWLVNRGLGRPVAESLDASIRWFRGWLDEVAGPDRAVLLIGFSGGTAEVGALLLADPARFADTVMPAELMNRTWVPARRFGRGDHERPRRDGPPPSSDSSNATSRTGGAGHSPSEVTDWQTSSAR